jgi:CBS domain-containing protein
VTVPAAAGHTTIAIPQVRRPEMGQIITAVAAREPSPHPRPDAATAADLMRPPPGTVSRHDHAAAAAYLMKHAGTTAVLVTDAQTGRPAGIITAADLARAVAAGNDPNNLRAGAVMTTRPALTAATSIRDAATIMTTRQLRHPPALPCPQT